MRPYTILLFLLLILCACSDSNRYADSFIIGNWSWQDTDLPEGFWEAHDAFTYSFQPNGVFIKSGGPDPIEPTKYCYELTEDSLLHLYISSTYFYDESYMITKVTPDTIFLRSNPSDTDHQRPLKMSPEIRTYFLVRIH